MKKTLSVLAVLGIIAAGVQSAEAFTWSSLNPANWGSSSRCCEKPKKECGCKKKCDPCQTGAAAPCDPCAKKTTPCEPCQKTRPTCDPCQKNQAYTYQKTTTPCEPCQKLQEMNK